MISDIVQTAITAFDNAEFTTLTECPVCGGPVQGYDTRQKRYIVMRDGDSERVITVKVKRFLCRHCKTLCNADEPFYPGTRTGSLVIDLYFTLSATMPASRAARIIDTMGIVVDRTTWRNYCRKDYPVIPAADIFGMRLPISIITLSTIAASDRGMNPANAGELLTACGYPSSHYVREKRTDTTKDHKKKLQAGIPMASSQGM